MTPTWRWATNEREVPENTGIILDGQTSAWIPTLDL